MAPQRLGKGTLGVSEGQQDRMTTQTPAETASPGVPVPGPEIAAWRLGPAGPAAVFCLACLVFESCLN